MKRGCFLLVITLIITLSGCKSNITAYEDSASTSYGSDVISGEDESVVTDSSYIVDWSDITVNGLDEDSFVQKLDSEVLQDVAEKLQSLVDEELAEDICAVALSELTGLDFMNESGDYYDWTSGKEYLELFNKYIVDEND